MDPRYDSLIGHSVTLRIAERARKPAGSTLHPLQVRLECVPLTEWRGAPLDGAVVGLQDKDLAVTDGTPINGDLLRWDALVVLMRDPAGSVRWHGSHVHGPSSGEFLYLYWRNVDDPGSGLRVKIEFRYAEHLVPEIVAARRPLLVADVSGRVPHDKSAVPWRILDLNA